MSERTRNIVVGFTALLGLAALLGLLVLFGYAPVFLDRGYPVTLNLDDASGLSVGSRVRMKGIDIGQITQVEFDGAPTEGVKVTVKIRDGHRIPVGAKARPESGFLGGSAWIVVDISEAGGGDSVAYLPTDGSAELELGHRGTLVDGIAGPIMAKLDQPLKKFEEVAEEFKTLSQEWTEVGKNLNELTRPLTTAQVDAGDAQGNLSSLVTRADQRLAELQKVLDGINQWVNDPTLKLDLQATLANAKDATGSLKDGTAKLNDLAGSAKDNLDTLTKRYVAVADDLSAAIGSMKLTLDEVRKGQGTMGKLIQDPALYNNLNDTAERMGKTLDEMKLLIEKWKAEGLPVKF